MSEPAASPPPGPAPGRPPGPLRADDRWRPDRLPPADEPEPIYPAEVHAPHAHRTPPAPAGGREGRPLVERLGMAAGALVITIFFTAVGVVSFAGGELLQGLMAFLGALLSAWVGLLTLRRG
jgi:hypothetical protein